MTTEEKARRYDEAIEKARIWKNKSGMPKDRQGILDDIFPELKESEDERIRKRIIHLVNKSHEQGGYALPKDEAEEMIAYLEKQGEQKLVQETEPTPIFKIGDILKRKGKDYTFRVDRIQGGYYHCDRNHGAFFPIEEQGLWQLVAQKSAWSEDDEKMFDAIVCSLDEDKLQRGWNLNKDDVRNWLKSFKEIVPNLKWSEEDKIIIGVLNELVDATPYKDFHNATKYDCINFLRTIEKKVFPQPQQELNEEDLRKIEHALIDTYAMDSASKILNKIKSLRPQNMWKPSDEQLEYLLTIKTLSPSPLLESLYVNLKKLREE